MIMSNLNRCVKNSFDLECSQKPCCPTKPTTDHRDECGRLSRVSTSAKIVENLLDIGSTLVRVLINCGIHECKAQKALDVIIYSFMFFEEVREHPSKKCKKRIRKKEFLNDLMENCEMTKTESKMTYAITKAAFKAFYNQSFVTKYDASAIDPCDWKMAVEKTVDAFKQTGATESEVNIIGGKICNAYNDYLTRRHNNKTRDHTLCQQQSLGAPCCCKSTTQPTQPTQPTQQNFCFQKICKQKCGSGSNNYQQQFGVQKAFCSSWMKATSDSNAYPELEQSKSQPTTLQGRLIGQYCVALKPSCGGCHPVDTICNPVVLKDCLGRTYMMVQGNKIFFDPDILINEAKRVTADLRTQDSEESLPET